WRRDREAQVLHPVRAVATEGAVGVENTLVGRRAADGRVSKRLDDVPDDALAEERVAVDDDDDLAARLGDGRLERGALAGLGDLPDAIGELAGDLRHVRV